MKANEKGIASIIIVLIIVGLIGVMGFFIYQNSQLKQGNTQTQPVSDSPTNSSDESANQQTANNAEGMVYQDPCESGDVKGCIMEEAYQKLSKSSQEKNYTIVWSEAFKVCEKYPSDQSILFSIEQCKLDVCQNLHLGDGNIKYDYPKSEECEKEVLLTCPNGSILENIPCSCDYSAGPLAAFTEEWLNNYWNKHRKDDPPIYCCDGMVEKISCPTHAQ